MIRSLVSVVVYLFGAVALLVSTPAGSISDQARRLHFSSIVADTHDDTALRVLAAAEQVSREMQSAP